MAQMPSMIIPKPHSMSNASFISFLPLSVLIRIHPFDRYEDTSVLAQNKAPPLIDQVDGVFFVFDKLFHLSYRGHLLEFGQLEELSYGSLRVFGFAPESFFCALNEPLKGMAGYGYVVQPSSPPLDFRFPFF